MFRIELVQLNTTKKPFDDQKVRQALNYAVNKEALVSGVLRGNGTVAVDSLPVMASQRCAEALSERRGKGQGRPCRSHRKHRGPSHPNGERHAQGDASRDESRHCVQRRAGDFHNERVELQAARAHPS